MSNTMSFSEKWLFGSLSPLLYENVSVMNFWRRFSVYLNLKSALCRGNYRGTYPKGPSTKDVRQMGRGVVLKFRTFPDGGRGWFVKVRTSENF